LELLRRGRQLDKDCIHRDSTEYVFDYVPQYKWFLHVIVEFNGRMVGPMGRSEESTIVKLIL